MKKIIVLIVLSFFFKNYAQNADNRVITTGVPFLLISSDARASGLGDMGVATSADAFSQQWNPAKYAFASNKFGATVSYTPYLVELANDIAISQVTFYNRFQERMAVAGSLRFFSLGEIQLTDLNGLLTGIVEPSELAFDLSYALKLSETFSTSVAARYIRSQLRIPDAQGDASAASSFAFDIAAFYQSEEAAYGDINGKWRLGLNLQNLGPKINYDSNVSDAQSNFLPANMRLGGGFDFIFDDYNKVSVTAEVAKLLVPTPGKDLNGDGKFDPLDIAEYKQTNWVSGIFQSFGDAPDGFAEEVREMTFSGGVEYSYQNAFALRLGYFNEHETKGARKFFSLGAGFKYSSMNLDVSYLFSSSNVRNPLENTLRFSLTFNFGESYDDL
jgi:Type IX secretion system protein PorV